jgi:hypothetical protein
MSDADVRLWHLADIRRVSLHVRFWVNSGHQRAAIRCLLLTQSGHRPCIGRFDLYPKASLSPYDGAFTSGASPHEAAGQGR